MVSKVLFPGLRASLSAVFGSMPINFRLSLRAVSSPCTTRSGGAQRRTIEGAQSGGEVHEAAIASA